MEVNFKYYSEALHYFSKDAVLGFSVNGGNARKCQLVLHQYNKKKLLLRGAVYYRQQRFAAEGCVVVVGQVSSISNLA